MINKLVITGAILGTLLKINAAQAGYGIDCTMPTFFSNGKRSRSHLTLPVLTTL